MSKSDSEDLTRVGPGTVMGQFMRQYWVPAAMSSELQTDGDPMRLVLLGEKLIAFRDSEGRVGIMDHLCPHRCASLFLGRNEENGLRCVYHGWKFDVQGRCVDMPSVPPHQDFKEKVQAKAYRTHEANGLVWVYLGDRDPAPPPPLIEASLLSVDQLEISMIQRECNYLQALEGDIDTSHFGFLHVGHLDPADVPEGHPLQYTADDRAPQYQVRDTDWGTSYGAFRPIEREGKKNIYWRFSNFMFPFWTQTPQGEFAVHVHARAWVPMDDTHTMFVSLRWKAPNPPAAALRSPLKSGEPLGGARPNTVYLPNTTDWYGRWRLAANEANDWLIDREAQKTNRIYTGIDNIFLQDQAVTESMGGITDHSFEHLGPGDLMIARTRRRLLQAARAFRDKKGPAPGVNNPEVFMQSRSGYFLADPATDWLDAFSAQVTKATRPLEARPSEELES